jgi:hypothetical protein
MCPHGRHSLVGSDVTFNVSKIILDSSSQFHIGRTDLRTTPVTQSAFWDTPDLGEFLGADELPATTSVRGFNPERWQLERKDDPRGVDVGRAAAIIPSCSVCPRLKQIAFRMLHLIHRCQVSAGLVMLSNLIHSFRRVQQLFVRVIFLPGISGSAKWTRNLERPRANRFVEAGRSLQTRRIKLTTTVSSASSAGTWALICGEKRPPAHHHNCISGTPNHTASCAA